MKKKQTTGERIADEFASGGDWGSQQRKDIARRIDSALKRAVREGYDAGWEDGMSHGTNAQNDGWNRLARKYGMRGVE